VIHNCRFFRWVALAVPSSLLAAASIVATPIVARAQTAGSDVSNTPLEGATSLDTEILLNAPVITATGREQSRALAPANVVTWERDEIYRHGWTTLAEVLGNTPGLYVIDDLVVPALGVRGVSPGLRGGTRLVRVMINGTAVNFRPDLTAFMGSEFIPFEMVERIEIAKGPLSALYGANAFLATVNVITRQPTNGLTGELGGQMRVINSNSGLGFSGRVGYGNDKVNIMVAYSQETANRSGLTLHKTFANQDETSALFRNFFTVTDDQGVVSQNKSQDDKTRPKSVFGAFNGNFDSLGLLKLQGGIQSLDSVAEFQPGSTLTHASRVALTNNWANLQYVYGYGRSVTFSLTADVAGGSPSSKERLYSNADAPQFSYTRNFGYTLAGVGGALEASLPAQLELKVGADYFYDREDVLFFTQRVEVPSTGRDVGDLDNRIGPNDPRQQTISNAGVYAQLGGNPFSSLSDLYLLGNIRYDAPNLFKDQLSWRLGMAYQWSPRVTSKLFVGHAFQTPSGVQLFAQPGFGSAYNTVGNRTIGDSTGLPAVEPQKVFSTEFATTYAVTNSIAIDGSVYYQRIYDKVDFTQISTNFTTRNLANQDIAGGELGFRASSSRFGGYFTGSAQAQNYTDTIRTQDFGFKPPPEFPSYTIYSGLTTRLPEAYMAIDVTSRIVGPRTASQSNILLNNRGVYELPTYATFDLTLTSLDIFLFGEQAETRILAGVKNIFDARYSYTGQGGFDIPSVGRQLFFRLSQTF
jgi:outer membrane receptor protein involved in Fe transport